jgi:hypothetical protein
MSEQDDSYLDLLEEDLADKEEQIEMLEAELARLRAQLAAVPVDALRSQSIWVEDQDAILSWLRSLEPQP